MKRIRIFFIIAVLFICTNLKANNIVISNITSVTGSGFVQLQFDLSWENSWKSSINYDAAWVFFKFKDLDGTWRHLNLTNANNSITSGYTISVPGDLTGAMVFRNTTGSGTVTLTGVRVGVTSLPGSFDIKGFALEMVQMPGNDLFYLGDGTLSTYYSTAITGVPYQVFQSTVTLGTLPGNCNDGIQNGVLAVGFPVGYTGTGSIYMMKHEVSQGAYRDFLNSLTYDQQTSRTAALPNSAAGTMAIGLIARRNGIKISTAGVSNTTPAVYSCDFDNDLVYNEATDGEWIACNYMTYMDLAAFLDWSALRPMTEMEFEKACRGTVYPVLGENAAGTIAAASTTYSIINSGAANEAVSPYTGSILNANITYTSTSPSSSPLRVGIHATAFSNRISAGAGYYGALELSGNIEEVCVTTGCNAGRTFTGVSGDGTLTATGDADENFWPGINGNNNVTVANTAYGGTTGVTSNAGVTGRGGSAGYVIGLTKVSNRTNSTVGISRINISGGRGVKAF